MLQHEMGFNEEQLYTIKVPYMVVGGGGDMDYTRRDAFTDELKKNPNILEVAYGDCPLVGLTHMGWTRNYKDQWINFSAYPVSWNFLQMMSCWRLHRISLELESVFLTLTCVQKRQTESKSSSNNKRWDAKN